MRYRLGQPGAGSAHLQRDREGCPTVELPPLRASPSLTDGARAPILLAYSWSGPETADCVSRRLLGEHLGHELGLELVELLQRMLDRGTVLKRGCVE